jgi:hypothetical protein
MEGGIQIFIYHRAQLDLNMCEHEVELSVCNAAT